MKNELPSLWRTQLIVIIVLFSVGLSLFPLGLSFAMIPVYVPDEYGTTFDDRVEVNLTLSTPDVNISVGECFTIEVDFYVYTRNDNSHVTIRVLNSTDILSSLSYFISIESLELHAIFYLDTLPLQNYTVQFHRETQDVTFQCNIFAYSWHTCVLASGNSPFVHWLVGIVLIAHGVALAGYFTRRNKQYYTRFWD